MLYDIIFETKSVGTARVEREGLYYRIECRCEQVQWSMVRLCVSCGAKRFDLGVMIPEKGGLVLKTRIAIKRIGEGELLFSLNNGKQAGRQFVAVYPDEPFLYLHRLNNAFADKRDGQIGIVFQKEISTPTGQ